MLFFGKKKDWQPLEIEPISTECNSGVSVLGMYKVDGDLTGEQIARKYTSDDKCFIYCDFKVVVYYNKKLGMESRDVFVKDTEGGWHLVGYLSDYQYGTYKAYEKKKIKQKFLRMNIIGNIHLFYFFE